MNKPLTIMTITAIRSTLCMRVGGERERERREREREEGERERERERERV